MLQYLTSASLGRVFITLSCVLMFSRVGALLPIYNIDGSVFNMKNRGLEPDTKDYNVIFNTGSITYYATTWATSNELSSLKGKYPNSSEYNTQLIQLAVQKHIQKVNDYIDSSDPQSTKINPESIVNISGLFASYPCTITQKTLEFITSQAYLKYVQIDGMVEYQMETVNATSDDYASMFDRAEYKDVGVSLFTKRKRSNTQLSFQRNPHWGLDRIVNTDRPSILYPYGQGYYYPSSAGEGVVVYVLDSGIKISHAEFEGRASYGKNYVNDNTSTPEPDDDLNGHGTAVASLIGGKNLGVAKKVKLISYKVTRKDSTGMLSWFAQAVGDVIAEATNATDGRLGSLISYSVVFGSTNTFLNEAAVAAQQAGVPIINAAGNNNKNACITSPTGSGATIAVGSVDRYDGYAYDTNYGQCVPIYAPGVSVMAASISSDTGTTTVSGTSFAAPIVSGAAALLVANDPSLSPTALKDKLVALSTPNVINGTRASSSRNILYLPESF